MKHPIDSIEWVMASKLTCNHYNPNTVLTPELKLLKHSILSQGWLQPILVTRDLIIIDGFHRFMLASTDKEVAALTDGLVPCAILDLTDSECKVLTVRINRAKGVHSAVKMHELVTDLIKGGMSVSQVCTEIGATKQEVELLLQESIFKKLNLENYAYSEAWNVKEVK